MTMRTATIELPAILVSAIQGFNFTEKPLWPIGEGLDHVKIDITFKLPTDQSTCVDRGKKAIMSKGAKSRTKKPASPAGEWPRQPLAAERPQRNRLHQLGSARHRRRRLQRRSLVVSFQHRRPYINHNQLQ